MSSNPDDVQRSKTNRGFQIVEFPDCCGEVCQLQQSSLANFERPGTSAIWLGIGDPEPKIMAAAAARLGVKTRETTGWVPFPLPDEVLLTTRMHLDLEQAKWLVAELQHWIDNGTFRGYQEP